MAGAWVGSWVGAWGVSTAGVFLLVPGHGSEGTGAGGFLQEVLLLLPQLGWVGHLFYLWTYLILLQGLLGLCCSIETRDCIKISTITAVLFE